MKIKAHSLKTGQRVYSYLFDQVFTIEEIVEVGRQLIRFRVKERPGIIGFSIHLDVHVVQDELPEPIIVRIAE